MSSSLVLGLSCCFQRCSFSQKTVFLFAASCVALPTPHASCCGKLEWEKERKMEHTSSMLFAHVPHGSPCSAVEVTDPEKGRVLTSGFAGSGAGGERGDPGANTSQGQQGRCSEAPGDLQLPGKYRCAVDGERLSACPGGARAKSNFQTQVDKCLADLKP